MAEATQDRQPRRRGTPIRLSDRAVREFVLQTFGQSRWTQDSPIVPDVWIQYLRNAESAALQRIGGKSAEIAAITADLILTPWTGSTAAQVAKRIRNALPDDERGDAAIAASTSRVVLRISFESLVRFVIPTSGWWQDISENIDLLRATKGKWNEAFAGHSLVALKDIDRSGGSREMLRFAILVGMIGLLARAKTSAELKRIGGWIDLFGPAWREPFRDDAKSLQSVNADVPEVAIATILESFWSIVGDMVRSSKAPAAPSDANPKDANRVPDGAGDPKARIWLINLNRTATQAVAQGRRTIKADAAQNVFAPSTHGIKFAIIDNGIDATHPAFLNRGDARVKTHIENGKKFGLADLSWSSRVEQTYDFSRLRGKLADSANNSSSDLDWTVVSPLIRLPHDESYVLPAADHGTHVAGILAADWPVSDTKGAIIGICPQIGLYDLRVFAADGSGDEFSILCAIEFVLWLNRDRANPVIHGVNMSLALRHDVASFACGRTPICDACDHLVGAGTVVVAAAGNAGFDNMTNPQSMGNGYHSISITDPGNAELVITVGSTHRRDPHAYGVSFFSSRGPTGDGRMKPDILAPGEKIVSTIPGGGSKRMDGTSMAAPHVSGAAALLMARYPELVGRPRQIKDILMQAATDLKRERCFQGAGLVDVLRALQSV